MTWKSYWSKRKGAKKGRAAAKRKARTTKPSKAFVKKVQTIIHKDAESKQVYFTTGNSLVNFNSGISAAADCQLCLGTMSNGSADNQRIGDEVKAQTLNIRGYLNLAVDTATNSLPNRRVAVRLMVVSPKRFPNFDDAYTNFSAWGNALLKKGGTQSAFTGQIPDLWAPINTDEITKYYDRVFYLSQDYIKEFVNTTNVGNQLAMNIQNTIKMFNINIKCRNKKLRYDASTSSNLYPTNYGPVLLVGYAHLDGSSPDVVTTQVGICYDSTFTYEDI